MAINLLKFLLIVAGGFVFFVIISSIFSWWDYRNEETELLNNIAGYDFRKSPSFSGIWRWFEFWFLVLVLVVVLGGVHYADDYIIPIMKGAIQTQWSNN